MRGLMTPARVNHDQCLARSAPGADPVPAGASMTTWQPLLRRHVIHGWEVQAPSAAIARALLRTMMQTTGRRALLESWERYGAVVQAVEETGCIEKEIIR